MNTAIDKKTGFSIESVIRDNLTGYMLSNQLSGSTVVIEPFLGGTVSRLALVPEGESSSAVNLLYMDSTEKELIENPWFRGRILFPFNDRIKDGCYTYRGKTFFLEKNDGDTGDAIHGFLYKEKMDVVCTRSDMLSAELTLRKKLVPSNGYPFEPVIAIHYILTNNCFSVVFKISNDTSEEIPFSIGWHPYFILPGMGESVDALHLQLPAQHYVEVDGALMPTGEIKTVIGSDYDYRESCSIGSTRLDTCFCNAECYAVLSDKIYSITVMQSEELFSYTQVFIPPDRKSIAIEPVSAAADAFNGTGPGLRYVSPGETIEASVRVVLTKGPGVR